MKVAIIGAGPLGLWLAIAAARAGFSVRLEDVMPADLHHAQEQMRRQLGAQATGAVAFVSTIEDAVRDADLVIDCVPDELESKLEILCLLDRMAPPRTIIATPTKALSITDLASCTYRADRCVALATEASRLAEGATEVSVITTSSTSPDVIATIETFWKRIGIAATIAREEQASAAS